MSFNRAYKILREECEGERLSLTMIRSGRRTKTIMGVRRKIIERLLKETDLSLMEVAHLVGLRSPVRQRPRDWRQG